uniref:Drought induced 19 protein type zinc-binding domain-containing protein n=1 Tax=Aegilops tauschii subsp. strangulata TaxID=200361 RepID=A0A453JZF3_AEGTS
PFCGEEFDGVGLCLHIEDEHAAETKAGVCPICTDRVGMDLVGHMTSEHPSFFKGRWRNQRVSSGSPSSMYSALKKDAAHIQYRYDSRKDAQEELLEKVIEKSDASEQKAEESAEEPLLPEEKEERTKRSQFVQGLVLSLMFDDIL